MSIIKQITSIHNTSKWQNIEKNIEIEEARLALNDNSQLITQAQLIEYISGETRRLENHINNLDTKNSSHSIAYATPQALIVLIKNQFKHLDAILKDLIIATKYQVNENSFLTTASQQQCTTFLEKIIELRQTISSAVTHLVAKSADLNYPLNNSLYTLVLLLKAGVSPVLELINADQSLSDLFAEPGPDETGLNEIMIDYLKQMEYLPYKIYMTLLSMELSEQIVKEQPTKTLQNELKRNSYIPLDKMLSSNNQ